MTLPCTAAGTLLITAAVVVVGVVGFWYDEDLFSLLVGRFVAMLPTTAAYVSLYLVAVVLELATNGDSLTPLTLAASGLALVCSWCGSWYMNDVFDTDADAGTGENRATADGRLTTGQTLLTAIIFWTASLGYAAVVNWTVVFGAAAMIGLNLLYSVPPIRLKRSGIGSMGLIGLMGATAVFHGSGAVTDTPSGIIWRFALIVTVFMTLNLSYKDLKDAEEDARTGVENFVVSFGKERVRQFLLVSLPVSYLLGAVLLGLSRPSLLAVFGTIGLGAIAILESHDISKSTLTYRLDLVNATYLVALAASYYAMHTRGLLK